MLVSSVLCCTRVIRFGRATDNIGNASANMALGQRRADSVKSYFVQEHGIVSERLESISYGDTRPVAANEMEEGRSQNRRVEVH